MPLIDRLVEIANPTIERAAKNQPGNKSLATNRLITNYTRCNNNINPRHHHNSNINRNTKPNTVINNTNSSTNNSSTNNNDNTCEVFPAILHLPASNDKAALKAIFTPQLRPAPRRASEVIP